MNVTEELLSLNQRLLDSIAGADWKTYAELCDPTLTAFFSRTVWYHLMSMKFFTYLEAGLPIISSPVTGEVNERLEAFGAGLILDAKAPRGLRDAIHERDVAEMIRGTARLREYYSTGKHGRSLVDFIRSVRESRNRSTRKMELISVP